MTKVFSPSVPVSQPVLTLSPPGTRTLVGNEVRLQCEVQRGSSPIWYQFFHEDVLLTKIEATSWRTKSYSFSVTAEHSGNYYCTADNGFGPQSSETINLSVIGKLWIPASDPSLTQILVMPTPFRDFHGSSSFLPHQLNAHLISLLKEPSICGLHSSFSPHSIRPLR